MNARNNKAATEAGRATARSLPAPSKDATPTPAPVGGLTNLTPDLERWRRRPRPVVSINMAMTADGKIATVNHAISSFGSARDEQRLYELRAQADCVICGARTADRNNIDLGPGAAKYRRQRLAKGLDEYNLRVIVSGSGTLDPAAAVLRERFSPLIILVSAKASKQRIQGLLRTRCQVVVCGRAEVDLQAAVGWLRTTWRVRTLLCEGGGALNDAMFRAGLVDKLHLTVCPFLFGGRSAPTIADGRGVDSLDEAFQLRLTRRKQVGDEIFLSFRRA